MVWYSHLLKNFPQFIVIHIVKGFGIVNEAEVDVLWELSCFFYDPTDVGNLISGSSAFSKPSLYVWKLLVNVLLKPESENSLSLVNSFETPWTDSPGQNTGLGSLSLLQVIFPAQGSNPGLLHYR